MRAVLLPLPGSKLALLAAQQANEFKIRDGVKQETLIRDPDD